MGSKVVFDVCASTGEYTDHEGNSKQRWLRCGVVIKNDEGRVSIKLDAIPVRTNEKGELWLSCFKPKPRNQQQPAQQQSQAQQPAGDGFSDKDIPF